MAGTGRLDRVVFDAAAMEELASFYVALAGWTVVDRQLDSITMRLPDGQQVAVQHAPDHLPPRWPGQDRPQQAHLDLLIDGHEAAAERAVDLGATRLAAGPTWITVADPAGHPIDLCRADGIGPEMGLWAVALDAPDASALARFYAGITDMAVSYDGPRGAAIAANGRTVFFQEVSPYNPPRWPDPAQPQQAHLDIAVDDLDAGQEGALERGGSLLSDGGDRLRVLADPAGHPFCLRRPEHRRTRT
jgi:catechol-2,3-dioxygenase